MSFGNFMIVWGTYYKRWLSKIKTDVLSEDYEILKTANQIYEFEKNWHSNAAKHDLSQSFLHLTHLRERVETFKI